jgi:hypothetical protein
MKSVSDYRTNELRCERQIRSEASWYNCLKIVAHLYGVEPTETPNVVLRLEETRFVINPYPATVANKASS